MDELKWFLQQTGGQQIAMLLSLGKVAGLWVWAYAATSPGREVEM